MAKILITLSVIASCSFASLAEARISEFHNHEAVSHVLGSQELSKMLGVGGELLGLELAQVIVEKKNGPGIGTEYEIVMQWTDQKRGTGIPTACVLKATTKNTRIPKAPVATSALSTPKFEDPDCAL